MQYREFQTALQRDGLKNIYLLTGEEPYYLTRARQELLAAFFPEGDEADGLVELEDSAPLSRLLEALETVPFFAPRNVVLWKGTALFKEKKQGTEEKAKGKAKSKRGTEEEERLLNLLANLPETNAVIFFAPGKADKRKKLYKTIEKYGTVLETEQVKPWQLGDWLHGRLRERQLKLERAAESYFIEAAGLMNPISLGFLDSELEKLELFTQGRRVTESEMREAFSHVPEISGFAMLDAIDAKNARQALSLLERQLAENTYLPLLLSLLVTHVRRLSLARLQLARGVRGRQLAVPLELSPYIAERVGRAAASYDMGLLHEVLLRLAEADFALKTGQRGAELLEQIVIALVKR